MKDTDASGGFVAPPEKDTGRSAERLQVMCCGVVLMAGPAVLLFFMYQQRVAQQALRANPPIGELVCVAAIGVPLALLGAWLLRRGWSSDARPIFDLRVDGHPLILGATHRLRLTTRLTGPGGWPRARVTLVCEEHSDSEDAQELRDQEERRSGVDVAPPGPTRHVTQVVLERARTDIADLPLEVTFVVPADAPATRATGSKPRRRPRGRWSAHLLGGGWSFTLVRWWLEVEVGEGPTLLQERQPVTVVAPAPDGTTR